MAPSTACSASLLHGIWRPASSVCRSADETAGDADVIPGRLLPVGVAEQGGRMVGDDHRDPPQAMHLIAQRAERLLRVEERSHSRHLVHAFTSPAIASSEGAWGTGSVLNRSLVGGSKERPAGGRSGCGTPDAGCGMPDAGCGMRDTGCGAPPAAGAAYPASRIP